MKYKYCLVFVLASVVLLPLSAVHAQPYYFQISDAPLASFPPGDDDGVVGYIVFPESGLVTDSTGVLGFQYTDEGGTTYNLDHIVSIRVLVDAVDGELCWRAADGQTQSDCINGGFAVDVTEDGLEFSDDSTGGYIFNVDSTAQSNFAAVIPLDTSSGIFLDRFVTFALTNPPADSDLDGDGLTAGDEDAYGTDPWLADTDGDTIPDGSDPDIVIAAIDMLPDGAFANRGDPQGQRNAMKMRLLEIQSDIASGSVEEALRGLRNLRRRVDGCATTAGNSPEPDDWITNCANQLEIRRLIDLLISNLEALAA